jgi:quercetin dioxygenase-like cupin family protein
MNKVNLNNLELTEFTAKDDPSQHCLATFPMFGAHGTEATATVYIELDPGDALGRHTDSAEELLLVIEGSVEVEVGGETGPLSKGEIAQVPKMVPHNLINTGNTRAKILGIFGGANNIVATFEKTWLPTNSNTVDTAQMAD